MELRQHLRIISNVECMLRDNHYPPYDWKFVPLCTTAVIACIEGEPEKEIVIEEREDGYLFDTAQHMVDFFRLTNLVDDEIQLQEAGF